jgi:hypothetical protein
MRSISRFAFVALVISLLVIIQLEPVLADEDVYQTEYRWTTFPIYYGDGIDNDADGEIDELDESDVTNGTMAASENMSVADTWSNTIDMENGVFFGGYVEAGAEITSSSNSSVSPTQTCYYSWVYDYGTVPQTINVLTYYIELKPVDIMTGTSEFWFRSPLLWDPNVTYEHYLNIFNEAGTLVFATLDGSGNPDVAGSPIFMADNSTTGTTYQRVYYKIFMPLRSNEKYTIKEYVKTIADLPLNSVLYFLVQHQDIADDGQNCSYIFLNTAYSRKIECEASWSMLCLVGIGRAGNEHLILGNDLGNSPVVQSDIKAGGSTILNVKAIDLVIPMRLTKRTNLSLNIIVESGGGVGIVYAEFFANVTGSICGGINVADPDPGAPNTYQIAIFFTDYGSGSDNEAITFTIYDEPGSQIEVSDNNVDPSIPTEVLQGYSMFFEVYELSAPHVAPPEAGMNVSALLYLFGAIIAGVGVIVGFLSVQPALIPFVVFLQNAAVTLVVTGLGMMTVALNMPGVSSWIVDQLKGGWGRTLKDIIDGIGWVLGGLMTIGGMILEAIKWLGSAWQHWGGAILEAFVEIVYFIIFLLVMLGWTLFLSTMRFILHGDFEGAWRFFRRGFLSPAMKLAKTSERFAERQTIGRYKKVVGYRRQGITFRKNQRRQNRKTAAFEGAESARGESYREQQEWYKRRNQANRSRNIENDNAGQGVGGME